MALPFGHKPSPVIIKGVEMLITLDKYKPTKRNK